MKSAPPPNYPILIALAYWEGDAPMMRSLVKLIVGMQAVHAGRSCAFMLVARRDAKMDNEMVAMLAKKFDVFTLQSNRFEKGWPAGCNGMFAATITQMVTRRTDCDSMFWLETDCVPMRPDWHQILALEWKNRQPGVNIVGCRTTTDGSPNTDHITGCAIYDAKIAMKLSKLVSPSRGAWDWEFRRDIVRMGQHTDKIILKYRATEGAEEMMAFGNPPAIVHGWKNKSLLGLVAKKYGVNID